MRKLLPLVVIVFAMAAHAQVNKPFLPEAKRQTSPSALRIRQLISAGAMLGDNDTGQALRMLWEANKQAQAIKDEYLEGKAAYAIGDVFFQNGVYNRALPNYSRAADLFYEKGTTEEHAMAALGLAKSQYYRGNYTRATANFVDVIKRCDEEGLPEVKAEAQEYLGLIYSAFQNFRHSKSFYLKSLQAKTALNDQKGIVRIAAALSDVYYRQHQFDSALLFANQSLHAAEKTGLLTDGYLARLKKASALIHLKNIEAAQKELSFFTPGKISAQDANLRVRYETLLGSFYAAQQEETASQRHFDSALAVINIYAFPELLLIVYEEMAAIYYDQKNLVKAYEAYKKYNSQLSFFYTGDNIVKLANLEGLVSLERSQDEIRKLNNDNTFKALALQREKELRQKLVTENGLKDLLLAKEKQLSEALARENAYRQEKLVNEQKFTASVRSENALQKQKLISEEHLRSTLLIGLALLLVLGSLTFVLYHRQRKKSNIIARQASELQTLIKEMHHRVKNNLQIISSLLDLQSISIQDKEASDAVKEGKNRVLSMALIHQNLYTEDNIRGIWVQQYIQNLVNGLFDSYNIQQDKIRLHTDVDPLNLDVDTVVPIGLIINELVSNSLKYAFAGRNEGDVWIKLKQQEKELLLAVKDNGVGFSPAWTHKSDSFGYKLIKAFTQKLKAKLDMYTDGGACVIMHISKYKLAAENFTERKVQEPMLT